MNKTVSGIIMMLLLVGMLTLVFNIQPVKAGTIAVPDDYPTIQEAINHANEGDTIFVKNGTYYEHVVVNKTVSLIGENREATIIDGNGIGAVLYVNVNHVNISGFKIQHGGSDLFDSGICLHYSNNSTISDNNVVSNHELGVYVYHSHNNILKANLVSNNGYGVWITYSENNTIDNNNVIGNHLNGITLVASSNGNTIINNTVSNNAHTTACGIYIAYSSHNTLRLNNMTNNGYNFGVYGTSLQHYIQDIDASNKVDEKSICYLVSQHNKQVPSDAGYVAVVNSTKVTVKNVNLRRNWGGMLFAYSSDSTVENSNILDNYSYGICLDYSDRNGIYRNVVSNNWRSVHLYHCDSNIIYHNNFIENQFRVFSVYSVNNVWDNGYPSGGNYWSDYTGDDVKSGPNQDLPGSDVIGDTPYIIDILDPNIADHYPLMNPYGAPPPPTYVLATTTTVGGTTNPAPGTYSYTANSSVQVTAIPNSNYLFHHWELESINVGSANPYTIVMNKDHTLKSVFSPISPSIPVGGYSVAINAYVTAEPLTPYLTLIAILTISFTTIRRKTHKKTKQPSLHT